MADAISPCRMLEPIKAERVARITPRMLICCLASGKRHVLISSELHKDEVRSQIEAHTLTGRSAPLRGLGNLRGIEIRLRATLVREMCYLIEREKEREGEMK